jgi:hypothetical protein
MQTGKVSHVVAIKVSLANCTWLKKDIRHVTGSKTLLGVDQEPDELMLRARVLQRKGIDTRVSLPPKKGHVRRLKQVPVQDR